MSAERLADLQIGEVAIIGWLVFVILTGWLARIAYLLGDIRTLLKAQLSAEILNVENLKEREP